MRGGKSHIDPETYEKYINGLLSNEEAYEVEKIMQASQLYEDALDGLSSLDTDDLQNEIKLLKGKIPLPSKKQRIGFPWNRLAASLLLVIISIFVFWLILSKEQPASELSNVEKDRNCLLYTSPSPRDQRGSRMPSSA